MAGSSPAMTAERKFADVFMASLACYVLSWVAIQGGNNQELSETASFFQTNPIDSTSPFGAYRDLRSLLDRMP
jgi:hypothetical protein